MLERITSLFRRWIPQKSRVKPEGEHGIQVLGHREYVGGLWDEIGRLQLDFLVSRGLKPSHCLLDIGCGSLRGGVHFIRYLGPGNYLGIDKERRLIDLGIERELGQATYLDKKPAFVVSSNFEFDTFGRKPEFSIAQSLFTHLVPADIHLCLKNLRKCVDQDHVFFATFFEGLSSDNPRTSHSQAGFSYSQDELTGFAERAGWRATYIGDWSHPRNQMMMKFQPA